jgi:hypothetical protein
MPNDRIPKRKAMLSVIPGFASCNPRFTSSFLLVIEYWVLVINWGLVIGDWLFDIKEFS